MASSSSDRFSAHSLWLQRRSTRRSACRAQWRSDWTPIALFLFLIGLLLLLSVFVPSGEDIHRVKEAAAQDERGDSPLLPMAGVLTQR
jgi:hypothetical protein